MYNTKINTRIIFNKNVTSLFTHSYYLLAFFYFAFGILQDSCKMQIMDSMTHSTHFFLQKSLKRH